MKTNIYLIKFSRTSIKDYCWLIKADNVEKEDYHTLELIFKEYKLKQVSPNNHSNCGLIELSAYYCYFSCYKTNYTDNYNREIFALDGVCIRKEDMGIVGGLYLLLVSNPEKYIQHENCVEKSSDLVTNFNIDISEMFAEYYTSFPKISRDVFTQRGFCPTFQGFDEEFKACLMQIIRNKSIKGINNNGNKPNVILEKNEDKKCTISVFEEKRYLFGTFCKYVIKGTLDNKHELFYIEKYFTNQNDLQAYIDEIQKRLIGYNVCVVYDNNV